MEEMFSIQCIEFQITQAICECAAQIEDCEDKEARAILIKTMNALLYKIDPPRGEVVEVHPENKKVKKNG